ncbi:hypothetical protein MVEN_02206000 [Mycena venus]|uniref:Uncharacterized protein n=1 Tax=Mycena venus TaxID=2733690 RepID=A0A8H6X6R9_9AGAR|nr:hypothetical protein MVEN_02206000 [Mycena venus]
MFTPAVVKLQTTTEEAIERLELGALPQFVELYREDAEGAICEFYTPDEINSRFGCGKAQFALALLVALRDVLPECYQTRAFLLGIMHVVMADTNLDKLALRLQTRQRDDLSAGAMFLMVIGSLFKQRGQHTLQKWVNAVFCEGLGDIKALAAVLVGKSEVLKYIKAENAKAGTREDEAQPFKDTTALILENLRRHSQGMERWKLLKFKCTSFAFDGEGEASTLNDQKRSHPVSQSREPPKKRVKKMNKTPQKPADASQHQQTKAQEAYIKRQIKRSKANRAEEKKSMEEGPPITTPVAALAGLSANTSERRILKKLQLSKPKLSIPQGSSSIPLATTLAMEIDVMLLIPRRTSFGTAAPLISDVNWLSIPVNDSSKCESFLAIGKYILEACVSDIVYQQEYNLPLTDELVLNSLTSNRTLQSVLMRTGVFSEPNIVPVHFPAKAFKVYLGALFLVEALPFACIFTWLNEIFMPIAHSLRHKPGGMGDYRENRAVLAAAGYELGSNR